MPLAFRSNIALLSPSRTRWLQIAGCGVLVLASYRVEEAARTAVEYTDASVAADIVVTQQIATRQLAAAQASLGLSSIQVIVSRNDTLDRIFRRLQLSISDLATLRAVPELTARLDRLYPGELLKFHYKGDEFVGLERQLSASETLSVVRQPEGFSSNVIQNPLEIKTHTAHAVIRNSLFQAADAAGMNDATALAIADIFAWDIDFVLDIQPGDEFFVTYEEVSQDGKFLHDGNVLAARFVNRGRSYEAVRYVDPDGNARYFTPDGKSLRRAFLRTPVSFTRVSSGFNRARLHPILNRIRAHKGVDYAAPTGTPVHAAGDGHVSFAGRRGGYGNVVEIDHAHGISTVYGHLSRFSAGLHRGDAVRQGEIIGAVGMTGLATGPHLHYEYRINGVHRDPRTVPLPNAEPVPQQWLADFQAQSKMLLGSLAAQPAAAVAAR